MTREEINKYIHEEIMGKCVHDRKYLGHVKYGTTDDFTSMHDLQSHGKYACHKCPDVTIGGGGNDHGRCPHYCSDDSPRLLLNEVVAKVIDGVPLHILCQDVLTQMDDAWSLTPQTTTAWLLTATAEQIARACVEAHKRRDV